MSFDPAPAFAYPPLTTASSGLRTCYIPRVTEDLNFDKSTLKSKQDGGDYDIVVSGIDKIVEHL